MREEEVKNQKSKMVALFNTIKYFLVVYFIAVSIIYGFVGEENIKYKALVLVVPVLISFCVRMYGKKQWIFWLVHICNWGLCILLGTGQVEKIVYGMFGAILAIVAWIRYTSDLQKLYFENNSAGILVLAIPSLIYGYFEKVQLYFDLFALVVVIFMWLHFMNIHLANRYRYLLFQSQTVGSMDDNKMTRESNKVMAFFSIPALVILLLGSNVRNDGMFGAFFHFIKEILRKIFGAIKSNPEKEAVQEKIMVTPEPGLGEGVIEDKNNIFVVIIQGIAFVIAQVLKVLMVVAVVGIIFAVVYVMYLKFREKEPEVKDDSEKISDKVEQIKTEKAKRKFTFFLDNNQKIRKRFKKQIIANEKEKSSKKNTCTSKELTEIVEDAAKSGVKRMLPYYQKARYSGEKISREEWKEFEKDVIKM